MRRSAFWSLLVLSSAISSAVSAQSLDAIKVCSKMSGDTARLACYDTAIAATDTTLAAEIAARRQEAEAQAAQAKVDNFGASALPADRQPQARVETPTELTAKIEMVSYDPYKNLVALLDNGQTWVQTESQSLPNVRAGDDIRIKRGLIGGYRMTIKRISRSFSVQRTR